MLWYSLEAPRLGTSNEYSEHKFLEEIRKILFAVILKTQPHGAVIRSIFFFFFFL